MDICQETGKICFSYRKARETINSAKRRHYGSKRRSNKIPIRSYYCKSCHCYHLTSKSDR